MPTFPLRTHLRIYPLDRVESMTESDLTELGGIVEAGHVVFRCDDEQLITLIGRLGAIVAPAPPLPARPAEPVKLPEALPRGQWPLIVAIIARFATDEDRGVGDTIHRAAAAIGAEMISRVLKSAGVDCGCAYRRAWLNARFPYIRHEDAK